MKCMVIGCKNDGVTWVGGTYLCAVHAAMVGV